MTLDPRNPDRAWGLGQTYMAVNRYADAKRSFRRALALDPGNVLAKTGYADAILYDSGDIKHALAAVRGDEPLLMLQQVDFLRYQGKYRDALALLERVPATADNFSPDVHPRALRQANLYLRMGNRKDARPLFEQALARSRARLKRQHGISLAAVWQNIAAAQMGLGHTAEALDAISQSRAVFARTGDRYTLAGYLERDAALYAEAGRPDLAVPLLARALAMPGIGVVYSPVMLWIDPAWDRIRNTPRFQALLKKYAKYKPAGTPEGAQPTATVKE